MATLNATPANLSAQIKAAQPGDVISLVGDFPDVVVKVSEKAAPGVVIQPADGATLRSIFFTGCAGFTVRGFRFTAPVAQSVKMTTCKRIVVEDCQMSGDVGLTDGVWVRWCEEVTVRHCAFANLWHGIFHEGNKGLVMADLEFRDIYGDAIRGGLNSDGVTIQRITATDLHQVGGDHLDVIQFWTTKATQPTRNVLIEDVVYRRGEGDPAQGVLIGNEAGLRYENVTVRRVAAVGGLYNGISISGGGADVVIEDCFVQPMEGAKDAAGKVVDKVWIQTRGSTGGVVRDSFATLVQGYQNAVNASVSGFTAVPMAKAGDYSALEAWLKRRDPPADARDAELSELRADLAAARVAIAERDVQLAAAEASAAAAREAGALLAEKLEAVRQAAA